MPPLKPAGFDPATLDHAALKAGQARAIRSQSDARAPITRVLPVPRAIPLGGVLRVVREWTLGDLAELQAWVEGSAGDPLEGLPPSWADPDPTSRPGRLARAWERAQSWPPKLFTDVASRLLGSPAGRAFQLVLNLRGHDASFGVTEAALALPEITPAEWAAFERTCWAITPRAALLAELAPDETPGQAPDWYRAFDWLVAAQFGPGLGFDRVAAMTIGQWRALCGGGSDPEHSQEFAGRCRRARAALEAPDGR